MSQSDLAVAVHPGGIIKEVRPLRGLKRIGCGLRHEAIFQAATGALMTTETRTHRDACVSAALSFILALGFAVHTRHWNVEK